MDSIRKSLMSLKHKLVVIYFRAIKVLVGLIPKNNSLIIFSAWFGNKYADSTMYLYEYMLKEGKYKIYWFTKNNELYRSLLHRDLPVLYSKTLKAKWKQCRAKMLLSTIQYNDFNTLLLNRCILFDLDHGFPGKPVALAQPTVDENWRFWYYFKLKGVEMYQTASSKFVVDYLSPCYDVSPSHYIFANKPRIDVLFDKELQKDKNRIIEGFRQKYRIISYLPTHRSCGRVPMELSKIFDLEAIQQICENNNTLFIIKKHFYHRNENEDISAYKNIMDMTHEDLDTQVLLAQSDVLVTDFSSCFNDYLALNRPIVFYAYDYDDYLANERDYFWKYDMIEGGYTAKSKMEFTKTLYYLSQDWSDLKHAEGRKAMRRIYFDDDVEMGTSREKLSGVIDQLIKGTYIPYDWDLKKEQ